MGRSMWIVLRFLIGVISLIILMSIMGISWSDVTNFLGEALKSTFDILKLVQKLSQGL